MSASTDNFDSTPDVVSVQRFLSSIFTNTIVDAEEKGFNCRGPMDRSVT